MIKIYGFLSSYNTLKVLYCAEEIGIKYNFHRLNSKIGEHKSPEYLKIHPLGKAPALVHDGKALFESGVLCKYMACITNSPLYPEDNWERCLVDQWMDFNSLHIGRWISTLLWENYYRGRMGLGAPKLNNVEEAQKFLTEELPVIENHFANNQFYLGKRLTIADFFSFAYCETHSNAKFDFTPYKNISRWMDEINKMPSVKKVKEMAKAN